MNRPRSMVMALITLTCLLPLLGLAAESTPAPKEDSWGSYRVIVERNIFSRSRNLPRAPTSSPESEPISTTTESVRIDNHAPPPNLHVLVGISIVGDQPTALFEDRRDGSIHPVRVGDVLADCSITAITLDRVTLDEGLAVEPGQTLAGESPAAAASPPATIGSSNSSEAVPSDPATLSTLERLRLRRQQELQR